jgi:hypothetical protein
LSSLIAFKILIPVCLIAGIISFHLLTIRDGQPWGDDFSMYLQHARNLAECKQYGDPQFIFNPNTPVYAPRQYPIGYPLTILPLYALFGIDFYPYKVFNIFLLGIALGLVYYWLISNKRLEWWLALLVISMIGLNPFYWDYKDNILSDYLFFCWLMICFIVLEKYVKSDIKVLTAITLGALIYWTCCVRTLGICLLPALWSWSLIEYRRIGIRPLLLIAGGFISGLCLEKLFLGFDNSFLDMVNLYYGWMNWRLILASVSKQAYNYFHCIAEFWGEIGPYADTARLMGLMTCLLLFAGYCFVIRHKITIVELYFACYVIILIAFPGYQGFRYLIPFMPFGIYYVLVLIQKLNSRLLKAGISFILIFIVAFLYIVQYKQANFKTIVYGIQEPKNQELFAYIRSSSSEDAIFMCEKPRAIHLYTGRIGMVPHWVDKPQELLDFCRNQGVSHVIPSGNLLIDLVHKLPDHFEMVFNNEQNSVYKIRY